MDGGTITEWGECLPDCPSQEIEIVCQMDPIFPPLASSEIKKSVNYSTEFVAGKGTITPGMSYVAFSCPLGFVFEDSTNVTHYAFCYNTTFDHQYDPSKACVRKFILFLF